MKFLFGSRTKQKKTILFVFVQNAGRSQMAEAFLESMLQKDMNYKRRHKAYFSNRPSSSSGYERS
jgi:hypothetical protein